MRRDLVIAVFAGLGGMLGWGIADFFAKKTIDAMGDVPSLFWAQFIGIFPLAALFLHTLSFPHFRGAEMGYLVMLGIWSGLSYIPTYIAFGKGKVSVLSPLFASYAVVVTILSAICFKEAIPIDRQMALVVVFLGIVLINGGDPRNLLVFVGIGGSGTTDIKGLKEIVLAIFLYSIWLVALDRFVNGRDWVPFLLVIRIFSALSLFVYATLAGRELFPNPVDGHDKLSGDSLTVDEHDAVDQVF